ncbi:MAG: GMC family oxidoreductase [Euzebyales bacterium]|nr:GMC family oxidoreductase [Euzebyales bacterium]
MKLDGRGLTDGAQLEFDVCIVGAGVAGITIARELEGCGLRVGVLESGGTEPQRSSRDAVRGPITGYSYYRHGLARARAFGGSSRLWPLEEGWRARPLDPIDFEVRPGIDPSGWPVTRDDLRTYYERAQRVCDLGPFSYEVADWQQPDTPPLPLDGSVSTTMFQLGSTDFGRYLTELERSEDIWLYLHATVVDIRTDNDATIVDRLVVAGDSGCRASVLARLFVLAGGGIDNPRLLLASRSRQRNGIGNEHDLVGRYFMERLSTRSGWIAPSDPALPARSGLYSTREAGSTRVEGTLRLHDEVIRREQLLNCVFFLLPRSRAFTAEGVRSAATLTKGRERTPRPADSLRHLRNIAVGAPSLLRLVCERLPGGRPSDMVLAVRPQAEQLPNPSSRVTLDRRKDRFGLSRAALCWRLSDLDRWSIRRSQDLLAAELRRCGIGTLQRPLGDEDPPALFEGNKHHMGTTRMHDDPRRGVVDRDCRVHGLANLYVAGSSVFPTAGASNPTLTIVALALRLAEHVKRVAQAGIKRTPRVEGR